MLTLAHVKEVRYHSDPGNMMGKTKDRLRAVISSERMSPLGKPSSDCSHVVPVVEASPADHELPLWLSTKKWLNDSVLVGAGGFGQRRWLISSP